PTLSCCGVRSDLPPPIPPKMQTSPPTSACCESGTNLSCAGQLAPRRRPSSGSRPRSSQKPTIRSREDLVRAARLGPENREFVGGGPAFRQQLTMKWMSEDFSCTLVTHRWNCLCLSLVTVAAPPRQQ